MSKDNEDKTQSKDPVQASIQKNPCSICRAAGKPKCPGHASGGGGSGDSANDAADEKKSSLDTPSLLKLPEFSLKNLFASVPQMVDKLAFDIGLFKLIFDRSRLTLTFKGKSYLTQSEQDDLEEFFDAVTDEFDLFKTELEGRGIAVENLTANRINNELTFKFPNEETFNQFVQRLIDKNYLPQELAKATAEQAENFDDRTNYSSLRTPFPMVPRPIITEG